MSRALAFTDAFRTRFNSLEDRAQIDIRAAIGLLEESGSTLRCPLCSVVEDSRHSRMRALWVQSAVRPLRVFYAFDPRRTAIPFIGGDKTGGDRFHKQMIPIADRFYDELG